MSDIRNASNLNTEGEKNDKGSEKFLVFLIFTVVSPTTLLTALGTYLLFAYAKIRRSVILLFAAPLLISCVLFFGNAAASFGASWTETLPAVISQEIPLFSGIFLILGQQLWLGASLGVLIGLGFSSWKWFTRARWKEVEFRATPWELLSKRKTIKEIQEDRNTPHDGATLGIDKTGKRVVQKTSEATQHTAITGGTGAGKTRTGLMRIRDQLKNGGGLCYLDLKNDPEVAGILKVYADRYGKKFWHFTLQDIMQPYRGPSPLGPAHYDPLSQGDANRRTDMILGLRNWEGNGGDFFKQLTSAYLIWLFTVLINNPNPKISTLEDVTLLFEPRRLQERARPLATNPNLQRVVTAIDDMNDQKINPDILKNLATNRASLETFLQGIAGPWLTKDPHGNNISLEQSARDGDIVLFSLDAQAYGSLASNMANLIVQDLKSLSSTLLTDPIIDPFYVFIDEFSSMDTDSIIGLVNKARASNMSVTLATQTLADLATKNPAIQDQLLNIVGSFLVHRANTADEATVYAGLTGTVKRNKVSQKFNGSQSLLGGISEGVGAGGGMLQETEEFNINPTLIQELEVGQMFYISAVNHRYEKVQCVIEPIADPKQGGFSQELSIESQTKTYSDIRNTTDRSHSQLATPDSIADEFISDQERYRNHNLPSEFTPQPSETVDRMMNRYSEEDFADMPEMPSFRDDTFHHVDPFKDDPEDDTPVAPTQEEVPPPANPFSMTPQTPTNTTVGLPSRPGKTTAAPLNPFAESEPPAAEKEPEEKKKPENPFPMHNKGNKELDDNFFINPFD